MHMPVLLISALRFAFPDALSPSCLPGFLWAPFSPYVPAIAFSSLSSYQDIYVSVLLLRYLGPIMSVPTCLTSRPKSDIQPHVFQPRLGVVDRLLDIKDELLGGCGIDRALRRRGSGIG
jgi:hypothetical protein